MQSRPVADQPQYGDHLGDVSYLAPYIEAALDDAGLAISPLKCGEIGTFPTFLVGDLVVKLFGPGFVGPASFRAERAMQELLAGHLEIPAPGLVGAGQLWEDEPHWPYLITERLAGTPIRDMDLPEESGLEIAAQLGTAISHLHRLEPPTAVAARDLLPRLRATAATRAASFGLPQPLVAQVPSFLADSLEPDTLVHADLTADHVFIRDGGLEAIIDWGDALVADPYYELVAAWNGLGQNERRLDAFLAAYGWERGDDFPKRLLQAILEFQFNALGGLPELVDLDSVSSLDELAIRLFGL